MGKKVLIELERKTAEPEAQELGRGGGGRRREREWRGRKFTVVYPH